MNRRTVQTIARQLADLAADAAADRPDADLLGRFVAARDQAAFAALVRRHGPMVWASCRHLLPNPADAEDAFQATFLALAQQAKRVRNAAALGGWLHGVAVRASLKVRRSEARRRGRERASAGPEAGRPVPDSAWDGLLAAVHEEVEHLPAALRTAFVLCDLEGVPQPAAAARLGWKPGTLTGRLARARQHLMARLTSRGLAPAVAAGGIGTAAAGAAVPPAMTQAVVALAGDPVRASAAVTALVTEVTSMTLTKVKLLAAGLMVAGGLGLGGGAWRTANVTAQAPAVDPVAKSEPPAAAKPTAAPKVKPALIEKVAKAGGWPVWEYRYAGLPDDPMQFVSLLDQLGADGWEYVGVYDHMQAFAGDDARRRQVQARNSGVLDDLAKKFPSKFHDASRGMYGNGALVFKRPKTPPQAVATATTRTMPATLGHQYREDREGTAVTVRALAAAKYRELVVLSGGTDPLNFDKIPQANRDAWNSSPFVRDGSEPTLPYDGTMTEEEFTKEYTNWLMSRFPRRPVPSTTAAPRKAPAPAAGQPPGVEVELNAPTFERRLIAPPAVAPPGTSSTGGPPDPAVAWGFMARDPNAPSINLNERTDIRQRMIDRGQPIPADGILRREDYIAGMQQRMASEMGGPQAANPFAPTFTAVSKPRTPAPEPLILAVKHISLSDAGSLVRLSLEDIRETQVQMIERTNTLVVFNVPPAAAARVTELLKKVDVAPAATVEERPVTNLGFPGAVEVPARPKAPARPTRPPVPAKPPVIESPLEPLPSPTPR